MKTRTIAMLLAVALVAHVHGQEWEWLDDVIANGGFDSDVTIVEYECVTRGHSCILEHADHTLNYGVSAYGRLVFQVDRSYKSGKEWPSLSGNHVSSWNCRGVGIGRQMQCERITHWDRWGENGVDGATFDPNKVTQYDQFPDDPHHSRVRVRYAGALVAADNLVRVGYLCHDTAGCGQIEGYNVPHCPDPKDAAADAAEAAVVCELLGAVKHQRTTVDGVLRPPWLWFGLPELDAAWETTGEDVRTDSHPRLDSGSTRSISVMATYRRGGADWARIRDSDSISCRVDDDACPDWFFKGDDDD